MIETASMPRKGLLNHNVTLEPTNHIYTDSVSGRIYDSISKVLKSVENEFEAEKISYFVARKQLIAEGCLTTENLIKERQQIILGQWEEKRDLAADHGTMIHKIIEDYLLTGIKAVGFELMLERMEAEIFSRYKQKFSEQIIPIDEHGVAGTADFLGMVNASTVDIFDWKTNLSKGIEFANDYNKFFKSPVDHLNESNYSKYCLQLSAYGYMLYKAHGYKIRKLSIVFIPELKPEEFKIVPLPFMLREAVDVMKSYRRAKQLFTPDENLQTL